MSQCRTKPAIRLVQPAKTQISLCNHGVWSVFADCMCSLQPPGYPKRDKLEPLAYWVDVQADPSLCWLHRSYCRFCPVLPHMLLHLVIIYHAEFGTEKMHNMFPWRSEKNTVKPV